MKYLFLLLSLLFLMGCGNQNKTASQQRILHIYNSDSLSKTYTYNLKIFREGNLIRYSYENEDDKSKNMVFILNTETGTLSFAVDEFKINNPDKLYIPEIKDHMFSFYSNTNTRADLTEPIIFNQDFGVIAIGNTNAPNFIFLAEYDSKTSYFLNNGL
ncbi:hypothetical protein ACJD0Z_06835 [Flavobacteriaceae bacterium M23B6Z8]